MWNILFTSMYVLIMFVIKTYMYPGDRISTHCAAIINPPSDNLI